MTSPAAEPAFDPRTPFTADQAHAVGIAPTELRTVRWRPVFRATYVLSDVTLTVLVRGQAGLLLHPSGAHLSHATAAQVYDVPVPDDPDVHVTVARQVDRRYRPGLRPHVREAGSRVRLVRGVPVSAPEQLFVELAGALPLVEAVVAGDAMIRMGLVTIGALREHCRGARGRHSRTARRVVGYVREGVDSPMETRLRMLIVLGGLPEPQVNLILRDESGAVLRRIDLSYRLVRLMVEYDGRQHVERIAQWDSDIDRREEFDADGWRTLIVTSAGIYRDPGRTLARIRKALQERGVRVGPLLDGWRAHFPGR